MLSFQSYNSKTQKRQSQTALCGLTLIEMLIGMAITLIMMAAVVTLFANIGEGVRVRRAGMEMNSQLRQVRARLFKDIAGATCPATTWQEPGDGNGYIEIIEGAWTDSEPSALTDTVSANEEIDYTTSLLPSGADPSELVPNIDGTNVTNAVTNGRALGDYDDILALTVRSESEPFQGRYPVWQDPDGTGPEPFQWVITTIESNLAEVIWYSVENPTDGSLGEPGMRTIYRRVLLIAPWVEALPNYVDPADPIKNITSDTIYYQLSDVSFKTDLSGNLRIPNSLSDLTKRENRFAHQLNGPTAFPHPIDLSAIRTTPALPTFPTGSASVLHPFGLPFEWDPSDPDYANPSIPPVQNRQGEDVILNDVLAFDLRVFDPGAPLVENSNQILDPSDAGWYIPTAETDILGFGSYIDIGWDPNWNSATAYPNFPTSANFVQPIFSRFLLAGSRPGNLLIGFPAVYDTWSMHYESDSIDQDGLYGLDQGTNGLDDPAEYDLDNDPTTPTVTNTINGPDDIGERETSPPYDVPLRGMQVKIRIYERDTRQIREATVTKSFVSQD